MLKSRFYRKLIILALAFIGSMPLNIYAAPEEPDWQTILKILKSNENPLFPRGDLIPSREQFVENYKYIKKYFPFDFTKKHLENWDNVLSNFYDRTTEDQIKVLSLDDVLKRSVLRRLDIKKKRFDVAQLRLSIISAIGRLLPHINISLTLNQYLPVNIVHLIKGLFSFVIPSNWFNVFRQLKLFKSEQYALSDLVIDRYIISKISYYEALQAKWAFAIVSTFYNNLQKYLAIFQNSPNVDPSFLDFLFNLTGGLADQSLAIKQNYRGGLLPELLININSVDENKTTIIDFQSIKAPDLDHYKKLKFEKYWDIVTKNSLKLKAINQLKLSSVANVGSSATAPISLLGDQNDSSSIGISLGLDAFSDPIIAALEVKKILVGYDQVINETRKSLIAAVNTYNVVLDRYKIHKFFLLRRKQNFEEVLGKSVKSKTLDIGVYFAATNLMQSYLDINDDYFSILKASAAIEKLVVTPALKKVIELVPSLKKLKT